jgi:hypothetical protein
MVAEATSHAIDLDELVRRRECQLQPSDVVAGRKADRLRLGHRRQLRRLRHQRGRGRKAKSHAPPGARQCSGVVAGRPEDAFTTKRDGNFEVYVMNADGSGLQNVTNHTAPDRAPIWLPGRIKGS